MSYPRIEAAIELGLPLDYHDENNKKNLLHLFISKSEHLLVKAVLESKYGKQLVNEQDAKGNTPLVKALKSMFEKTKLLLENGADVNIKCEHGKTALHYSFYSESIVKRLIKYKADVNVADDFGVVNS